ncbi:hypothetical protein L6279_03850, partial [Candidatus Parcubacteria bacterium]|nr:hypothetical protein [Candidatus Parcubacteria bacterium]
MVCDNEGGADCDVTCDIGRSCVPTWEDTCACSINGVNICDVKAGESSCTKDDMVGACRLQFGDSKDACAKNFFSFSHVYSYSPFCANHLANCDVDVDGDKIVSPTEPS